MIAFANSPLFNVRPITGWLVGTLVPKPGTPDEYAVELPSGRQLAVNPFGNYEDRPAGTFGGYESLKVRGTNLVYHYTFDNIAITHVIPFVGDL
jgi:hypothetical protein